jgi:hypothetical protein
VLDFEFTLFDAQAHLIDAMRNEHQELSHCREVLSDLVFKPYQPHVLMDGIIPFGLQPGLHQVQTDSPLFRYCELLCATGGSLLNTPNNPIVDYRLLSVDAVISETGVCTTFETRKHKMTSNRRSGNPLFSPSESNHFDGDQLRVLSILQARFHQKRPGTPRKSANTFYCFHGTNSLHVRSICSNGLIATRGRDAGFYGCGSYATLNIEYAIRYASGLLDDPPVRKNAPFPVIVFAAMVSMVYPITPTYDYDPHTGACSLLDRPLKKGFDAHVACIKLNDGKSRAVMKNTCEYVEIVFFEQAQLFPVAVMWFDWQ